MSLISLFQCLDTGSPFHPFSLSTRATRYTYMRNTILGTLQLCGQNNMIFNISFCTENEAFLIFQEPVNEIEKLARFLDVSYTKQLLSDIADKCSFDKMKTVQRPYSKNKVHEAMRNIPEGEDFEKIRTLYRKGKNTWTVKQFIISESL